MVSLARMASCLVLCGFCSGADVSIAHADDRLAQQQPPAARPPVRRPPAAAQAQPKPQPPGSPAAPAAASGDASTAAPGQPVPVRTEILNFENWAVTCREFAETPKKRNCAAQLQVSQQGGGNVVLVWTVGPNEENKIVGLLQTPTGVSIAPGVELKLGSAAPRKFPFATCDTGRCTALVPIDPAIVREMTATPNAEVTVHAPNGAGVQFSFAVKGFDKAYAELTR